MLKKPATSQLLIGGLALMIAVIGNVTPLFAEGSERSAEPDCTMVSIPV